VKNDPWCGEFQIEEDEDEYEFDLPSCIGEKIGRYSWF
jgi:hypothetical protein